MGTQRQEVRCPWCGEVVQTSGVKVSKSKISEGTLVERRCPKCSHILAAYLEEEGNFLPRMRTF